MPPTGPPPRATSTPGFRSARRG
uniref:Uncharacterized protein n=1 Tax=Arundo donax TaxID=35708 RepID=A0A0A9A944_ARUDO